MSRDGLVEGLEFLQIEYVEELALFYRHAFKRLAQWTVALGATSAVVRFCGGSQWMTPAWFGVFTGGMAVAAKAGADRASFLARRICEAMRIAEATKSMQRPPSPEKVH